MKAKFSKIAFFTFTLFCFNSFSQSPPTWSNVGAGAHDAVCAGGGDVMAMCTLGSDMYLTGWFATIDNVAAARVAKYNGTTFTALGTGVTAGGSLAGEAIAAYGGNIYIGGSFSTVGGVACSNIAMWNVGTSTWAAVGTGCNGIVRTLYVYGGELYAMGGFSSAGGVANTNGIAKWNGTTWSAVGAGLTTVGGVTPAMYEWGGNLYVGGTFANVNNTGPSAVANTANLAKWDGANWSSIATIGTNGAVYDITSYNGQLVIVGAFSRINNVIGVYYRMGQWNGTTWSVLPDMPISSDGSIYCCAVYQGNLYVAGNIPSLSGTASMNYVSRMGVTNTWTTVGTSPLNFPVYSIHVYNSGLYVGGLFGPTTACDPAQPIPEHIAKIGAWSLPVELISFSGTCDGNNTVKLNWATASESNNDYFTIEREKAFGEGWEIIAKVQGAGNSSNILNYEFIDENPIAENLEETCYYRLRQTDFDGRSEVFPITSVQFPCKDDMVTVFPNPTNGKFSVNGLKSGSEVSLHNILGETILIQQASEKFITLDISSHPKGIYFIKITSGTKVSVAKIILQ